MARQRLRGADGRFRREHTAGAPAGGHRLRWRTRHARLPRHDGFGARRSAGGARSRQDDRMRVVQLGPYPPPHGGVQTNLVAIREYLRRHGHACDAVNLTRFRREDADGVYYPEGAAALMRLLWRLPADILHLHFGGDLTPRLLGLALFCTLLPGRKTVLTFHSGGYPGSPAGTDGGARHAARIRPAPPAWIDRRQSGNCRPVRKVRSPPGTHPHDPPVCGAAAGPLAAATRASGRVPQRAQSGASDGWPAGAGIRFTDADRLHGRNSAAIPARRAPDRGCGQSGGVAARADREHPLSRSRAALWRYAPRVDAARHAGVRRCCCAPRYTTAIRFPCGRRCTSGRR